MDIRIDRYTKFAKSWKFYKLIWFNFIEINDNSCYFEKVIW